MTRQRGTNLLASGNRPGRRGLRAVCLLAACLGLGCTGHPGAKQAAGSSAIQELFPGPDLPAGWQPAGGPQLYPGDRLYEYIDGGAELYLEYGFREAATLEYEGPGGAAVIIDIFRMTSPEAAYGIFSVNRGSDYAPSGGVGTAGAVSPYQLIFCRGEYFVSIQSLEAGEESGRAMELFAHAVDSVLAGMEADVPTLVRSLPPEGLLPLSAALVHGPLALNSRQYLGEENIFGLGGGTWGALGFYRLPGWSGDPALLLVLDYPDSSAAGAAAARLQGMAGAKTGGPDRSPDLWKARGKRLAAWFGLPDEPAAVAEELADRALGR